METSVDDLPDECLQSILLLLLHPPSHRKSFRLACRRWLQIDSRLLQSVHLHLPRHPPDLLLASEQTLSRLLARSPSIQSLSFRGCVQIPDSFLTLFRQSGPAWPQQLRSLSLGCCFNVGDEGLGYVADGCPALTFLDLYRCNVSDKGLQSVARGCSNLESLNLLHCQHVSDYGVAALVEGCRKMANVNVSNCKLIDGWGFRNCRSLVKLEAYSCRMTDAGLCQGLEGCPALQSLNLATPLSGIRLGFVGLGHIGVACKSLTSLSLRMCRVLDDSAVGKIAQGCSELKEWNLAVCPEVTFEGWNAVALFCTNLETLHVNRCRKFCHRSLLALKNGCPGLLRLYLHGCPGVTQVNVEDFQQVRIEVQIVPFECMD